MPFPLPDVSRRQREIQIALSSDQRGSAGTAARHIQVCQSLEQLRDWNEANRQRRGEAAYRLTLTHLAEDLPACQAVDAASRAQLEPLLRRSLAEGDKGAAASLVTLLRDGFDPAAEPDVVAGLRRDAWLCDGAAISWLATLVRRHPQLLTPNEVGALREKERGWVALAAEATRKSGTELDAKEQAELDRVMDSLKPPPGADAAEVARLAADIQSHCPAPS